MSTAFQFDGKTAVITGAASGIGEALARELASRACNLALADINADALETVAASLRSNEIRVTSHTLDVGDRDAIHAFADTVKAEHGGADLLFNNAGVAIGGTFDQISESDFEWLVNINFWGPIRMARAFMPLLKGSEDAHITNISSIFGVIAPAGQTAYSASKFGVRGFSDALRHELQGSKIGVTTVHPGGVATNIAKQARVPKGTSQAEIDATQKQAAANLVMPPPQAAGIILRGVERRKPRVLVGRDAHLLAWMEKISPSRYWSMMKWRLGRPGPAKETT